jgi:hypothetical protein
MSQAAKTPSQPAPASQAAAPVPDPYPPYRRVYAWVFQAWLLMFLGVICCSLIIYLLSYIPFGKQG